MKREDEIECAKKMKDGDALARKRLIESYLPIVAGYVKRSQYYSQSLALVFRCISALEKAVDSFDFLQDREKFSHRLCRILRQEVVRHIAES